MSNIRNYISFTFSCIGIFILQSFAGLYLLTSFPLVLGMDLHLANYFSNMIAWCSIVGALSCLGAGVIMNNFSLNGGKAKPWLIWVSVPTSVFMCLIFFVPVDISTSSQLIYIAAAYTLYQFGLSFILISRASFIILMTDDHKTRSVLAWISMLVISLLSILPPNLFMPMLNSTVHDYRVRIVFLMVFSSLFLMISGFLAQERSDKEKCQKEIQNVRKIGILKQLKYVICNKYCLLLALISLIGVIISISHAMSFLHYITYNIDSSLHILEEIIPLQTISGAVFVLLVVFIIRRFDALKLVIAGRIFSVLGLIICFFAGPQSVALLFAGIIVGKMGDGFISVNASLSARLVEYIEWKHGVRQENLVSSILISIGVIWGRLITMVFTKWDLFAQAGTVEAETTVNLGKMSYYMYLAIPCALAAGVVILTLYFDLTEKKVDNMRVEIMRGTTK